MLLLHESKILCKNFFFQKQAARRHTLPSFHTGYTEKSLLILVYYTKNAQSPNMITFLLRTLCVPWRTESSIWFRKNISKPKFAENRYFSSDISRNWFLLYIVQTQILSIINISCGQLIIQFERLVWHNLRWKRAETIPVFAKTRLSCEKLNRFLINSNQWLAHSHPISRLGVSGQNSKKS